MAMDRKIKGVLSAVNKLQDWIPGFQIGFFWQKMQVRQFSESYSRPIYFSRVATEIAIKDGEAAISWSHPILRPLAIIESQDLK